jgi:hypothetical protein
MNNLFKAMEQKRQRMLQLMFATLGGTKEILTTPKSEKRDALVSTPAKNLNSDTSKAASATKETTPVTHSAVVKCFS